MASRHKIYKPDYLPFGLSIMLFFMMIASTSFSQSLAGKNKVILIGQVTSIGNGAPVQNQEVIITADTAYEPQFIYTNKVFTDKEGFYYDTIKFEGNKGALYIKTFDYAQKMYDTTVYFRFNWSTDVVLFANFTIPALSVSIPYHANFEYHKDTTGQNNFEYHFNDLTNSNDVISWHWNFGDGNFSTLQNPVHTYEEAGIYRVKLTVKVKTAIAHQPLTSSIVKIINVKNKSYFHMGGLVMAEMFPIDLGEAILYKVEEDELIAIDTSYFNDTLGFYYFYHLIEGDYIVKARPLPGSKPENPYHDTYFGDKIHWEDATMINHHSTYWDYDITLVPYTMNMAGPGEIGGFISYGYDPVKGKAIPAVNVEIILFDKNDHTRKICHSDGNGNFCLELLNLQLYYLYAEVTGKYTFPLEIVLDEDNSLINFVKITIGNYGVNGSVSSGIGENEEIKSVGMPYPNPARETINLEMSLNTPGEYAFAIHDIQGHLVYQTHQTLDGETAVTLDVNAYNPGTYYVSIMKDNRLLAVRRFIKN